MTHTNTRAIQNYDHTYTNAKIQTTYPTYQNQRQIKLNEVKL